MLRVRSQHFFCDGCNFGIGCLYFAVALCVFGGQHHRMLFENSGKIACAVKSGFHCGCRDGLAAEKQLLGLVDSEKGEIISKAFAKAAFEKTAKIALIIGKRQGGIV